MNGLVRTGDNSPFGRILGIVGSVNGTVLTGTRYTVDNVTSKVASLVDWLDTSHVFSQNVMASQVAVPIAEPLLRNALSFPFLGGQYYASNRPASSWRYLSVGPVEVWAVMNDTSGLAVSINTIAATGAYSFGPDSFHFGSGVTGGVARVARIQAYRVADWAWGSPGPGGATTINATISLLGATYDGTAGATAQSGWYQTTGPVYQAARNNAPNNVDPPHTLYIGWSSVSFLTANLAFYACMPAVLSTAQRTVFLQSLKSLYGVT